MLSTPLIVSFPIVRLVSDMEKNTISLSLPMLVLPPPNTTQSHLSTIQRERGKASD